ncbi:unnamed protein product, partial [Didymodactylos carnosus]
YHKFSTDSVSTQSSYDVLVPHDPKMPITSQFSHKRTVDDVFNRGIDLLIQKWSATPATKKFSDYFVDQWITKLPYWYEGAAFGKPSTNNGCESMNAIIKQKYTLRNKLQLSAFLPKMEQMLTDWSEASISSPFAAATSISPDTELYAYKWSVSINRSDIFHWFNTFYVVPSSGLGIVFNLYQVTDKTRCEPLGKRK